MPPVNNAPNNIALLDTLFSLVVTAIRPKPTIRKPAYSIAKNEQSDAERNLLRNLI
jgi:hypothetical protein